MRNTITRFVRIYVGVLMTLSLAAGVLLPAVADHSPMSERALAFVIATGFTAFVAAVPVLVVVALGWVACGGIAKKDREPS